MKLNRVEKQVPSAQVNVTLPGKLKAELDSYAAYYQQVHGEPIGIRKLIVEIARSFGLEVSAVLLSELVATLGPTAATSPVATALPRNALRFMSYSSYRSFSESS